MDVRALRERLGLTQARLARLTGVHAMTVSKWERGLLAPRGHSRAILAALSAAERGGEPPPGEAEDLAAHLNRVYVDVSEVEGMKLSASNQLRGKVVTLDEGPITSRVVLEVAPGVEIVSLITTASVRRLGLEVGARAVAIVKATEVILATG